MACRECGLNIHSEPTCIPGSGNTKSKIMIINSYAGDEDEVNGVATMPSHLLEFISKIGIDPKKVYYTNAIKCRCPKGTKYKVGEIKKCKVHLDKEIEQVNPEYILLIGSQALKATVDGSITTLNGVLIEKDGRKWMPALNPGIMFRDPGKTPEVYQAFNNFKELVNGTERKLPDLNIKMVRNTKQLDQAFLSIRENGYRAMAYDIETRGLDRFNDDITLVGFGNDKVQYIIPLEVKHSPLKGKKIAQKALVKRWCEYLNSRLKDRIAANGKFDDLFLQEKFKVRPDITFDVVLASHALNENTSNGLKDNAIREFNALDWDINKKLKTGNVETPEEYEDYITYLGYDLYYTYKLYKKFKKKLKEDKPIWNIYNHVYIAGSKAYEDIETQGVYIYPKQFKQVRKHLEIKLKEITDQLDKHKQGVNWSSPTQVAKFLYEDLKLPIVETTASNKPATGESTLLQLRDKHPAIGLILQYRGVHIQISHFIDGWINRMHRGRLYPRFKIHGTVTGRTSCTDPNLQQVPRDPIIRNLIGAPPGWSVIEADFSQAELRIAAIMSGDETIKRIYQTGGDIHTTTYELVSGEKVSSDKYKKKEQRKKAKAVNFGFVYGMGWKKFKDYARDTYGLDLTENEAKEYRKRFFEAYPRLSEWHVRQRKIVKSLGQVRSPIGRLRRLPDIYSSDQGKRAEAERQSINSPVQGFGSDLTLLGMIELAQRSKYSNGIKLDKSRYKLTGTVHDATLFEVRDDYLMEFIPKIKEIMENPKVLEKVFNFHSPVPIVVDVQVGRSWGAGIELHMDDDTWKEQVQEYLDSQDK